MVWPTKFENTLSFHAKQFWCLKILILGKLGLKLNFWKHYITYLCILFINFNALRCFCNVSLFFSNTVFFLKNFVSLYLLRLIQSVFRSIEFVLKFLKKPLFVSINRNWFSINWNWFSINRNSWIRFLKYQSLTFQTYFSKRFSNFFSLSELDKASSQFFVVFLQIFCKVFLFISQ